VYVGHTGTGFNERELARVMTLLEPLETAACPFSARPKTNERPHWVEPKLVAQIKFTEWTADNKLRHPVYVGLRDDKKPEDVHRETRSRLTGATTVRLASSAGAHSASNKRKTGRGAAAAATPGVGKTEIDAAPIIEQLRALEDARRDGVIELPGDVRVSVTNLHKIFWPRQKFTKGDLFRHYAAVAPAILPVLADRPLVMKRYPNGVAAKPFYQHRAEKVPAGVRVEMVTVAERRPHIIGGSLAALMYTTQLAAISQDPWFSRLQSPYFADHAALDLDPSDGVPFSRVLDVARWIHDELESLGVEGVPKTSGSDGLHIYIPLPPDTPYDAGLLFCQIVATVVTHKHPKEATVERAVAARGRRVYIDCLQNVLGKTLASAYSARASSYAGVSTPLTWQEVHDGVDREDFTIASVPARLTEVGDLWARLRESEGADLSSVAKYQTK
jgi:bifunctional non-homologous end joining protein LigD